jgi:hypothetical protein
MYYKTIILISALSFIFYSVNSLFSKKMISEYSRWGYSNIRVLIAFLQMLGGVGLLLGFFNVMLLCVASFLLMIMMFFAIIVRIRIKDSFIKTIPALAYTLLNFSIFYISLLIIIEK